MFQLQLQEYANVAHLSTNIIHVVIISQIDAFLCQSCSALQIFRVNRLDAAVQLIVYNYNMPLHIN